MLVNPDTNGALFFNKAAKDLELKAEGAKSFSFDHHDKEGSKYPSLARAAFVPVDKFIFMKNIANP